MLQDDRNMLARDIPVRVTFDDEADASCILSRGRAETRLACLKTVTVPADEIGGMVNLDLDQDGRLIGIEILDALSLLTDKLRSALSD
jgi:uncharacterized protein YuzE